MQPLDHTTLKHSFTTHAVPLAVMAGSMPLEHKPQIGQLVVAEVLETRRHTALEDREGLRVNIFPGDRVVVAFGNRYATDQYEGYVPDRVVSKCDLLSVGGVIGRVKSRHAAMSAPTRLRVLGAVCDEDGQPLSQRAFGLPAIDDNGSGRVIVVVGSAMNSGKTTTAGTLVRALNAAGRRVAAGKVTGTAAGRDLRYYASCGARPTLDFTGAGFPSTYMLNRDEVVSLYRTVLAHLRASGPDYVVLEIADGILQRETRMLLESEDLRSTVDHVLFSATDSLSAHAGVRWLRERGLPVRATSGTVTRSPLALLEAEEATGLACLSIDRMMAGEALEVLGADRAPAGGSGSAEGAAADGASAAIGLPARASMPRTAPAPAGTAPALAHRAD